MHLDRYKGVLRAAAAHINRVHGSANGALVLNLGPAWLSGDAYSLFSNNVIEIPFKDWESPPGLGICPLGVIFTVCSSIASWLALNEDHVVVRTHFPSQALWKIYAPVGACTKDLSCCSLYICQ